MDNEDVFVHKKSETKRPRFYDFVILDYLLITRR